MTCFFSCVFLNFRDICNLETLKYLDFFLSMKGSSDEFIDANIQLALAVVRKVQEMRGTRARIVSF